MKKKRFTILLITAVLITGLMLTGCAVDEEPEPINDENDEVKMEEITLYFMKVTETAFLTEEEVREVEGPVDPEIIGQELLKGPESEELDRIIPEDTKLLGVEVENSTAYVDFSKEILDAELGSEAENVLVTSIVWSFTELPEVDAVQILVEGDKVDSIAGHIEIAEPLTR